MIISCHYLNANVPQETINRHFATCDIDMRISDPYSFERQSEIQMRTAELYKPTQHLSHLLIKDSRLLLVIYRTLRNRFDYLQNGTLHYNATPYHISHFLCRSVPRATLLHFCRVFLPVNYRVLSIWQQHLRVSKKSPESRKINDINPPIRRFKFPFFFRIPQGIFWFLFGFETSVFLRFTWNKTGLLNAVFAQKLFCAPMFRGAFLCL